MSIEIPTETYPSETTHWSADRADPTVPLAKKIQITSDVIYGIRRSMTRPEAIRPVAQIAFQGEGCYIHA